MGSMEYNVEEVTERFFIDGQLTQRRVMLRRVYRPHGEPPFIGDPEHRRPLTTDDPPVVDEARTRLAFDATSWAQVQHRHESTDDLEPGHPAPTSADERSD